ncbi:MAG: ABC transporter permease [Nanoarchaeota archaeon]
MDDLIRYAFTNLKKRMLRSSLTILSILVGIMSIFILVSFGQGLSNYMSETFDTLGADKIIIMPRGFGFGGSFFFNDEDKDVVEKVPGVRTVAPLSYELSEIQRDRDSRVIGTAVMGMETGGRAGEISREMMTVEIMEGRHLRDGESGSIVVGYSFSLSNKVFERPVSLGERIIVHGEEMRIVGIYQEIGNPEDDKSVFMDLEAYGNLFGKSDQYENLYVQAHPNVDIDKLSDNINRRLRRHLNQEEGHEEFHVQTFEDLLDSYGNVIFVINAIVTMIALISVIVAAINTTNTMYTSVLERTQEIGIMKAIGARNSDILKIFLFESGTLGLLGGTLGIALGYLASHAGGIILSELGYSMLQPFFPWWLWVGSLIFAVTVGAVSGVLPAIQASKQNPVDALRYE